MLLVIKKPLCCCCNSMSSLQIVLFSFLCGGGMGYWCAYLARFISDMQVCKLIGSAEFVMKTNHFQCRKKLKLNHWHLKENCFMQIDTYVPSSKGEGCMYCVYPFLLARFEMYEFLLLLKLPKAINFISTRIVYALSAPCSDSVYPCKHCRVHALVFVTVLCFVEPF